MKYLILILMFGVQSLAAAGGLEPEVSLERMTGTAYVVRVFNPGEKTVLVKLTLSSVENGKVDGASVVEKQIAPHATVPMIYLTERDAKKQIRIVPVLVVGEPSFVLERVR